MKSKLCFLFAIVFLVACSNGTKKQQRLIPVVPDVETLHATSLLSDSETVLDTIIPAPGVKFKEKRTVNSQHPPVISDFTKDNLETIELDLADYYDRVEYVKLKYPFPDKSKFMNGEAVTITTPKWNTMVYSYHSGMYYSGDYLIAGDALVGFHCYDRSGNYLYSITQPEKLDFPEGNKHDFKFTSEDKEIMNFSVFENYCLILSIQNDKYFLDFHDMSKQKTYLSRPYYYLKNQMLSYFSRIQMLSPESFLIYSYRPTKIENEMIMEVFSVSGDTLCLFKNYNPLPTLNKGNYTDPDESFLYYSEGKITFRQAYNDTVFRIVSDHEIQPAFIFNFGDKKLDVQTGLYGEKKGKLIPDKWIETPDYIYFSFTDNNTSPNNLDKGLVNFFHRIYDKKSGKWYKLPEGEMPLKMKNSMPDAFPIPYDQLKTNGNSVYTYYRKNQLVETLHATSLHATSSGLTDAQKENLKSLIEDLGESDFLVAIFSKND